MNVALGSLASSGTFGAEGFTPAAVLAERSSPNSRAKSSPVG